ncbi:MAG TPA: OmpA family protein [Allosphingosinicella sp.]|nr:OmpA family protein [Allosphingosinicella sp.]
MLTAAFVQAVAPAPASVPAAAPDWLTCSSVRSPQGQVISVDQLLHIYFESGSARIAAQGAALLDRYVAQVVTPLDCRVTIDAHADRVGSENGNLRLSRLRAEAVGDYLRSRGLAAPITLGAFGEMRPLVETADGVAEPQNRRAEIYVSEPRIP